MLRDSVVVVVVRTRPQAIPLAMITIRKILHGFPFLSRDAYGAPLGGPSGHRSSIITFRYRAPMKTSPGTKWGQPCVHKVYLPRLMRVVILHENIRATRVTRTLLYGCVSQGLGTTESTNLIG